MKNHEDIAENIIKSFTAISKGSQLYPETHPAVLTPLKNVSNTIRDLHKIKEDVKFGLVNGLLFFEDHIFYDEASYVKQLFSQIESKNIITITILHGFEDKDLFEMLKMLASFDPTLAETGAIREKLSEKGILNVTVKYLNEDDIEARAKKTYFDALEVVTETFKDIRMGDIPKIEKTRKVVKDIVDVVFTDHNAMLCLTMIKNYDDYTFNHSVNVSILAIAIAKALNYGVDVVNEIGIAGLLHDIGKTHTEKKIIKKPGKLTDEEFDVVKLHPEKGFDILNQMEHVNKNIKDMVYQHHIHYDKKGYPDVNAEYNLNPFTTIISTADTYDAITTHRCYQVPVTPKDAINIMLKFEDKHFEKTILRKFIEILGVFPTGSFVRLDSNEIALVTKQNSDDIESPIVKIVTDRDGNKLDNVIVTDLRELDPASGKKLKAVVSAVDPTFIGLNIKDYI